MEHIDWAHAARVTVWTILAILAYLVLVLAIARWFSNRLHRREREEQLARLHAALAEAEARVAAARTNESAVVRRAEALGFFDGPKEMVS
jgi:uncharacterized membrane protein affecting hemolysin expression